MKILFVVAVISNLMLGTPLTKSQQDFPPNFYVSSESLLKDCSVYIKERVDWNQAERARGGTCTGFVLGVYDAAGPPEWANGRPFCIPRNASEDILSKVVYKYLKEHPEKLPQKTRMQLVVEAIHKAWPCPG
ncbi:MAG: hypothetical protein IH886_02545 [Nitrospinae bacterium]|nr:hypothetical protein [Nitrospinota bacterium]